jgi:formylglycine-generating enzyme required for sulfatase activity
MRLRLALLSFLLVGAARGQTISITVQDLYTQAGLPGSTVTLFQDGRELSTTTSDANGRASFTITAVGVESLVDGSLELGAPFPNPSTGISSIPMFAGRAGPLSVEVLDVLGRIVATRTFEAQVGAQVLRLDLAGVAAGTYFTRIARTGRWYAAAAISLVRSFPGSVGITLVGSSIRPDGAWKAGSDPNVYEIVISSDGFMTRSFLVHAVDDPEIAVSMVQSMTSSIGLEMVRIPAGTFLMGSERGQNDESPVHHVTLTNDFWIGRYEVTQGEYREVTGEDPSRFNGDDRLPVEQVTWYEAVEFANLLSIGEGRSACYDLNGTVIAANIYACDGYRLPTEAEWEYMARAGTTTDYFFGDDPGSLGSYAWYRDNSDTGFGIRSHPVGEKLDNPWGLHDVAGNVWEWVNDEQGPFSASSVTDPIGPQGGSIVGYRGGGWGSPGSAASNMRSAKRRGDPRRTRGISLGFRLARTAR